MIGNMHILLVEDSPATVAMLKRRLNSYHGNLTITYDGVMTLAQAKERLKSPGVDVVLLDLNLPDSAGIPTITGVFGASSGVPIVILTGNDNEEFALKCLRAGAQDYVRKSELAKLGVDGLVQKLKYSIARAAGNKAGIAECAPVIKGIEEQKQSIEQSLRDCKEKIELTTKKESKL